MTDRKDDKTKQPPKCKINGKPSRCPNMRSVYEGWEYERYRCEVCGETYTLDYEDMK